RSFFSQALDKLLRDRQAGRMSVSATSFYPTSTRLGRVKERGQSAPPCRGAHAGGAASFLVTRERYQQIMCSRGREGPMNFPPVSSPCAHQPVRCVSVTAPCTARVGARPGLTR